MGPPDRKGEDLRSPGEWEALGSHCLRQKNVSGATVPAFRHKFGSPTGSSVNLTVVGWGDARSQSS